MCFLQRTCRELWLSCWLTSLPLCYLLLSAKCELHSGGGLSGSHQSTQNCAAGRERPCPRRAILPRSKCPVPSPLLSLIPSHPGCAQPLSQPLRREALCSGWRGRGQWPGLAWGLQEGWAFLTVVPAGLGWGLSVWSVWTRVRRLRTALPASMRPWADRGTAVNLCPSICLCFPAPRGPS